MPKVRGMPMKTCLVAFIGWFLAGALWLHRPQLNILGFNAIRIGMTQAQVEKLLGGPPGDYGSNRGQARMTMQKFLVPSNSTEINWFDDTHMFHVYFDARDRVCAFHERGFYRTSFAEDLLETMRQWIRKF